jgi:tRNA uridine 5-carboxymethylaminomethyl modification enzyme
MDYRKLVAVAGIGPGVADPSVAEQVEIQVRYAGYLDRQKQDIERRRRHEGMSIAKNFDFAAVRGLSSEAREKMEQVRPDTIGQASRIPGMTPAAMSLLLVHLKKTPRQVA